MMTCVLFCVCFERSRTARGVYNCRQTNGQSDTLASERSNKNPPRDVIHVQRPPAAKSYGFCRPSAEEYRPIRLLSRVLFLERPGSRVTRCPPVCVRRCMYCNLYFCGIFFVSIHPGSSCYSSMGVVFDTPAATPLVLALSKSIYAHVACCVDGSCRLC